MHIYIYIYQNDKEIKTSYQVLRVSCKRVLQSSSCTFFFRHAVQGVLVPRLTKNFVKNRSFKCQIDLTGK